MTHALAPTLTHRHMVAYGLLGWPLAMVAMPVYLQAPSHYSGSLGLPLALTGSVLFLARLVDTVQDPWLGHWIGHWARTGQLPTALWLAAALLAASFTGLWLPPPALPTGWLALWLGTMLVLACTAHSVLHIAHLCWGARLTALPLGPAPTAAPAARVLEQRAAAWREGLGLGGIICASTLGVWLVQQHTQAWTLVSYAALFALLLALGLWLLLCHAPPGTRWRRRPTQAGNAPGSTDHFGRCCCRTFSTHCRRRCPPPSCCFSLKTGFRLRAGQVHFWQRIFWRRPPACPGGTDSHRHGAWCGHGRRGC